MTPSTLSYRGVDHLTLAGLGAMVERHGDAHDGVHGRQAVADGDAGARRRPVGLAGHIAQAAHGLADQTVAGALGIGTGLTEAGNAGHDQARVLLGQHVVAQAPLLHGARPEVLDHHVGLGDQLLGERLAFGFAQVQAHRLLVAPDHRPPGRQALGQAAAPLAHGIAHLRVLHLDHLGPEVAQDLAAERPGDQGAHLDDDEARKRAGGGGGGLGHGSRLAWREPKCKPGDAG